MASKTELKLVPSAAYGATFNTPDFDNDDFLGAHFVLDVTAVSGTSPTLDVKFQRKDPASGKYVDVAGASFAQKTGAGTDDLVVYPGATATANRSVSTILPGVFRAVCTIGGSATPTVTFTLGGNSK